MKLSDDLVVLDTETTGLDWDHDVWEVAFAVGEGPVDVFQLVHSLKNANLKALELNGYRVRANPSRAHAIHDITVALLLEGKTIIGANPAFDTTRLQLRWGRQPWHYRLIDVESMAIPVLDLDKPLGLKDLVDRLTQLGFTIPQNDHTAAGDVLATREVYRALRSLGRNPRREGW